MMPPRPDHRRTHLDAEDLRYRGLWWLCASMAALAVGWALQQEVVETGVVPVPERILEVVHWDRPAPDDTGTRAARRVEGAPSGGSGGAASPARRHVVPESPFGDLFAAPTFGSDEVDMHRWEGIFAEMEWEDPAADLGPGFQPAATDMGRTDALLPGALDELADRAPRNVVLADVAPGAPRARQAAVLSRVAPLPPVIPERVVKRVMSRWSRHPAACRDRVTPGWRGRVALVVWLSDGKLTRLEWEDEERVPAELIACLETRARHLLRFEPGEAGWARLPLVFE